MTQTTTNRGRALVPTPDLLYDTNDGGTALFGVVNSLWTFLGDHTLWRYYSTTLANSATLTITHNFGLALSKLKYMVFEGGAQRTDAQVAADYTIAQTSTSVITVQNTSGVSKTLLFVLFGAKLGVNSGDFDAAVGMTTTGTLTAAGLQQTGDLGLVLNSGASESGSSWKATLKRNTASAVADGVFTLPVGTSSLASQQLAETLALKTLTGCAGITLAAAAAIDWAAGSVSLGASIGANTLTLAGASSTVRAPGALSSGTLLTDSNDLVMNNAAAGSGADWKATLRRPSAGMTGAGVYTLPPATTTLLGTDQAQVVTLKDIDGGTASNTSRLTVPKGTTTAITALTRKQGTVLYDTTLNLPFYDDGSALHSMGSSGGGGGGGSSVWNPPAGGAAATLADDQGERVWLYAAADAQQLVVWLKVPTGYLAGNQIKVKLAHYSPDVTGTVLLQTVATLIQKGTATAVSSTTNQRTSTNAALNLAVNALANCYNEISCDLTSSTGTINSVAVAAGDLIRVVLQRGTDTATSDIYFVPSSTEVTFS